MSLIVEDVGDTEERHVGERIRVRWTIPRDVPPSEVQISADPGPTPATDEVKKIFVGPSEGWDGRDAWEYSAEILLEAAITDLELVIPDEARSTKRVTAIP